MLKAAGEKHQVTYKGNSRQNKTRFLNNNNKKNSEINDSIKVLF
jgi:hypothetical protein